MASTERGSWLRDLEKDLQKPVWEQQDECEARGFALAKVLTEVHRYQRQRVNTDVELSMSAGSA